MATKAGRLADVMLPPAIGLRLRAVVRRNDAWGALAPPRILGDLVPRGRVAIDVGAHRGLWTYRMAQRASKVHAFEPNPVMYAQLVRAHLRSVQAYEVAASDHEGTAVLSIPRGQGTGCASIVDSAEGGDQVATVVTRPLDAYDFTDVGFMKVDVEGHEEAVLNGASKLLATNHPVLFIEIEERHNPGALTRIPAFLTDLGYVHAYYLRNGDLAPFSTFDLHAHQLDVDLHTWSGYVNNFVFTTEPLAGVPAA